MITEKLTDFIMDTEYEKIPDDVIEKAKLCFMDFLGVALRGSDTESGMAVKELIKNIGESTVIGHGKAGSLDASLANGIFAHSVDLDDGHRIAHVHPGACVIPAALSLCEAHHRTGKEFICSIVVGYQIAIFLGIMINPQHRNNGFHSTGTCGTFGAAASACKALNLGKEETLNALGLAGTQACGLLESDHAGTMGKHLHAGKAAQSGVLSALLAERGFTGAYSIIDGKEGFLSAMADINTPDINIGGQKFLKKNYNIMDVYFKKYPVCRHLHSSIDAVLNILNELDIDNEDIQKIMVRTYEIAAEHNDYNPKTLEALKQSLPLSMAIAIFNRNLNLEKLKMDEKEEEITNISRKIVIEHDNDLNALYPQERPSHVIIYTKNRKYGKKINLPQGEPEHPFKKEELVDKFAALNPNVDIDVLTTINDLESYRVDDFMDAINHNFRKSIKE